jgi:hypothetical protein
LPPPDAAPANTPSPKRYDLVSSFDALALAGRNDKPYGRPGFVGGFNIPAPESPIPSRPPANFPYSMANSSNYSPAFPVPDIGPLPRPPIPIPSYGQHQQSLTMQHALSSLPATPPSYDQTDVFATNTPPPRPHSTSKLPPPNFGLSATPQPTRPVFKPSKSSSRSSSSSPPRDAVQCSGVTKAGKQCTRMVKMGPALSQVSPDADVERFCYQHTKEVLGPTGFYSKKTATDWIKFEGSYTLN